MSEEEKKLSQDNIGKEKDMCKENEKDRSIYEKPLGKLLLTIITIYSFLIAILALTFDKAIFFFLPASTILIGLSCAFLFYIVVSANINYFGKKLPKAVKNDLEGYSLNMILVIVCWFSLAFLYELYFVKESVSGTWLNILFIISQFFFGVPIIINQLRATLRSLSALSFKNKKMYEILQSIRLWLNKYNAWIIFSMILFHMTFTSFYFITLFQTDCATIFLDWFFFGELILTLVFPSLIYYIIIFCRLCNKMLKR